MAARALGLSASAGAYLAAVGLCVAGLGGAWYLDRDGAAAHAEAFRATAAATGRAFDAAARDVARTVAALDALGDRPTANPEVAAPLLSPDRVAGLATVRPPAGTGMVTPLAGRVEDPATLARAVLASATQLDVARDSGDPYVGTPVDGRLLVVLPRYAPGGEPATAPERRERLTSWLVGVVDLRAVAASVAVPGQPVALRVRGEGPGTTAADAVERSVEVLGVPWVLTVSPGDRGVPAASWYLLGTTLVAALGVVAVGRLTTRRLVDATETAATLERETRTVADIGPLLQRSLDLAEVLPAVAVRLSDEFDLVRLGVQLVHERGELVDVFALGGRPTGAVLDLSLGPARAAVAPETDVAFPLVRAGRTIGRLRVAARRELSSSRLDALRAAADLVAVATYNVEMYEREQANVRRLQEVDRLKDAFLGTISHELRTPITAIEGFVRLLTDRWDDVDDAQRRDFLARVGRNAASLGVLVDELLDFARLERQALSVSVTPLDLAGEVGRIVAQLVPLLGDHEVVTDLEPGATAVADAGAVERVVANLLTNAAKYSPAASRIVVSVRDRGAYAEVVVADEGAGIAPEERARVFTTFYRGDSEAARSTRGAGIGLAVVRELVQQMGGGIEVRDNTPRGTRMVVRLPTLRGGAVPTPRLGAPDLVLRSDT